MNLFRLTACLAAFLCAPNLTFAQVNGGQQGGQQGQQGQQGGQVGGIKIDPRGVVTPVFVTRNDRALSAKRQQAAAVGNLPREVTQPSPLRKISLPRLQAACAEINGRNEEIPEEMFYLAGLQRVDYVFVFPEEGDLVIAGPAEGFAPDAAGRMVGVETGRPPLRLDDLAVALRAVQRGGEIGCSIDPKPENLAAVNQFIARNSSAAAPRVIEARFAKMAEVLGMQNVRVFGVPPETHFAEVLVEADYRMKLIAQALERPPVRGLRSHLEMLGPGGNSLQRWWMAPLYEEFGANEDRTAFHFAGPRVQMLSQEEIAGPDGQRSDAPHTRLTTQAFARQFTSKYPELADAVPIFAELQNLFDLAVLAALLQREGVPQQIGWDMGFLLNELQVPQGNPPRAVATVANYRWARRSLIIGLVGGGVTMDPGNSAQELQFDTTAATRLDGVRRQSSQPDQPNASVWWWD